MEKNKLYDYLKTINAEFESMNQPFIHDLNDKKTIRFDLHESAIVFAEDFIKTHNVEELYIFADFLQSVAFLECKKAYLSSKKNKNGQI